MTPEVVKEFKSMQEKINSLAKRLDEMMVLLHEKNAGNIAEDELSLTDLEIEVEKLKEGTTV